MPDSGDWIYIDTSSISTMYTCTWGRPLSDTEMAVNEEYIQKCERQDRIMEQMMCENALREAERAEDRRKYPLFYWRENTK